MAVDVLAIGAHADDIELACAGTLVVLKERGRSFGIVDLTRGEMEHAARLRYACRKRGVRRRFWELPSARRSTSATEASWQAGSTSLP